MIPIIDGSFVKVTEIGKKSPVFLDQYNFDTLNQKASIMGFTIDYIEEKENTLWKYEQDGNKYYGYFTDGYYSLDDVGIELNQLIYNK